MLLLTTGVATTAPPMHRMTYDRASILRWFDECGKPLCPLTRQTVDVCNITTNAHVQDAIQAWLEQHADDCNSIALQDQPLQVCYFPKSTSCGSGIHTGAFPSLELPNTQVRQGHFLLPAWRPSAHQVSRTSFDHDALRSLVRSLLLHVDHASKVASLRALLDVAMASAEGRLALYRAGAVNAVAQLLLSHVEDAQVRRMTSGSCRWREIYSGWMEEDAWVATFVAFVYNGIS